MFGADRCGTSMKIHFIFLHKNPLTNEYEEKHLNEIPAEKFSHIFSDDLFHLLKLKIFSDNTYQVALDHRIIASGSLFTDFTPPVNPPELIEDPDDVRPPDWDEREMIIDPTAKKPDDIDETQPPTIPDPNAQKPQDWFEDEAEYIPDPNSHKPQDWDDENDGMWEPDVIPNPKCKNKNCGKWLPPMISNPKYKIWDPPFVKNPAFKGPFIPRTIKNPNYYKDEHPYHMRPIRALGFELWTVESGVIFDNILITSSEMSSNIFDSLTFKQRRFDTVLSFLGRHSPQFLEEFLHSSYFVPSVIFTGFVIFASTLYMFYLHDFLKSKITSPENDLERPASTPLSPPENDEDPLSDLHKQSSIKDDASSTE